MNHFTRRIIQLSPIVLALLLLTVSYSSAKNIDYKAMSKAELQDVVAALELGFDNYIVGRVLTEEQKMIAKKNNDYKAYPGTVKFKDGEYFVIADTETDAVIAVYTRNTKATKQDYKATVGNLMLQYGEPTAEAHGKTIYWNFGPDGMISEELYRTVKGEGKLETLVVLATVKFSSSEYADTMTDLIKKMEEDGKIKQSEKETSSDNYIMIQSDLLTRKYLDN